VHGVLSCSMCYRSCVSTVCSLEPGGDGTVMLQDLAYDMRILCMAALLTQATSGIFVCMLLFLQHFLNWHVMVFTSPLKPCHPVSESKISDPKIVVHCWQTVQYKLNKLPIGGLTKLLTPEVSIQQVSQFNFVWCQKIQFYNSTLNFNIIFFWPCV